MKVIKNGTDEPITIEPGESIRIKGDFTIDKLLVSKLRKWTIKKVMNGSV